MPYIRKNHWFKSHPLRFFILSSWGNLSWQRCNKQRILYFQIREKEWRNISSRYLFNSCYYRHLSWVFYSD